MCQTIPFNDPGKMHRLNEQLASAIAFSEINRNIDQWIDGFEQFFVDFFFAWGKTGDFQGLSKFGNQLKDHIRLRVTASQTEVHLRITDPQGKNPSEEVALYPVSELSTSLKRKRPLICGFLEILKPVFDSTNRTEFVQAFEKLKETYTPRGFGKGEATLRKETYFETTVERKSILDAFYPLYEQRNLFLTHY